MNRRHFFLSALAPLVAAAGVPTTLDRIQAYLELPRKPLPAGELPQRMFFRFERDVNDWCSINPADMQAGDMIWYYDPPAPGHAGCTHTVRIKSNDPERGEFFCSDHINQKTNEWEPGGGYPTVVSVELTDKAT